MKAKKKPNNYWNFEACNAEASKYSQRSKFEKGCGSAYIIAMRNGWLDSICSHMKSPQHKSGHWTEARCLSESKKYVTVTEFEKSNSAAMDAARRMGIYEECTAHMVSPQKPKGYWTKEKCLSVAKKYKSRTSFRNDYMFAYNKCLKNTWRDVFEHMDRPRTDANVFYLWKTEIDIEDKSLYKVGITSSRLGDRRIKECESSLGLVAAEVVIFHECRNARPIESMVKRIGESFDHSKSNGYKELFLLTESEVECIKTFTEKRL